MSGPMDFMFVRATHGRVVLAVFALRNELVWRDECDIIAGKADHNCRKTWDQKRHHIALRRTVLAG